MEKRKSRAAFLHEELKRKEYFDKRSFRNLTLPGGHQVTIGCRRGYYDARKKRCRIGTEAQRILHPLAEKNPCGMQFRRNPRGEEFELLVKSHRDFNWRQPRLIRRMELPLKKGDQLFEIGYIPGIIYVSEKEGKPTEYGHEFEAAVRMYAPLNRMFLLMVRKDGKPFTISKWIHG